MPYHLTMDRAVGFCAEQLLQYQEPGISPERKARILPATKYNLLVYGFNASTCLLTAAVVSAIFMAFTAAVTYGAMALFIRLTTQKQLNTYAEPSEGGDHYLEKLFKYVKNIDPKEEREARILTKAGVQVVEKWDEDELFMFDYAIWKNPVAIP